MATMTKRKNSTMTAGELVKLRKGFPLLMAELGFRATPGQFHEYQGPTRFGCDLGVNLHTDTSVWMPCKFQREAPPHWVPGFAQFDDVAEYLGANPFSGKYNCHILDRMTAKEALDTFRSHLRVTLDS